MDDEELMEVLIWTDASVRMSAEKAGVGGVIYDTKSRTLLHSFSHEVPYVNSSNSVEYMAMIEAAEWCLASGTVTFAHFHTDSQVVARQMNGSYAIKNGRLAEHHAELSSLLSHFKRYTITKTDRKLNAEADALAAAATGRSRYKSKSGGRSQRITMKREQKRQRKAAVRTREG